MVPFGEWVIMEVDNSQLAVRTVKKKVPYSCHPRSVAFPLVVKICFSKRTTVPFGQSDDGSLWTMGKNNNGQLGDGTNVDRSAPVKIVDANVTHLATNNHTMFVKNNGSLWGMGSNGNGRLGDGSK